MPLLNLTINCFILPIFSQHYFVTGVVHGKGIKFVVVVTEHDIVLLSTRYFAKPQLFCMHGTRFRFVVTMNMFSFADCSLEI